MNTSEMLQKEKQSRHLKVSCFKMGKGQTGHCLQAYLQVDGMRGPGEGQRAVPFLHLLKKTNIAYEMFIKQNESTNKTRFKESLKISPFFWFLTSRNSFQHHFVLSRHFLNTEESKRASLLSLLFPASFFFVVSQNGKIPSTYDFFFVTRNANFECFSFVVSSILINHNKYDKCFSLY